MGSLDALGEAVAFLECFEDLRDGRQAAKMVYPLDEVLLLSLLAVLAGAEGFTDIARFGQKKLDLPRRFRPYLDETPPHDTLGDIFEENLVHRALDDPGGGKAIAPQGGDEGLGSPMAEWRFGLEPLAALGSPAQPGHLGGGGGFVEEHQPIRLLAHPGLAAASPRPTVISDISATGFGRQHCFF